ncbi:MAG: hypothetical protein COA94_07710 [Rickettsiales bacterium]|nr:MAG: hypothetical protein COA94_07710 [Rickettsiales bacterium]
MTRLLESAEIGSTTITVDESEVSNWVIGDRIALAPSGFNAREGESFTILDISVDGNLATITVDTEISFYHFGAETGAGESDCSTDIRTEVIHLSRCVRIIGVEDQTLKVILKSPINDEDSSSTKSASSTDGSSKYDSAKSSSSCSTKKSSKSSSKSKSKSSKSDSKSKSKSDDDEEERRVRRLSLTGGR